MNKALQTNAPDKKIEKSATNSNIWAEITTLNVLPGEEVLIELENEDTQKEIQKGEKKIALATYIDPAGKGIVFLNSKKEIAANDITSNEAVLENNEASGILKEGKWTIDLEGTKPITRAVPGMLVYFHIKTSIPNGESVHIELYEDDNNEKEEKGTGDKDEHEPLVSSAIKKPATHETVSNGKIIKTIRLDNLEQLIKNDVDKQIELYFRCSYNDEHVELPTKPKDYLVVGTLVIDRYKMPGLNTSGTDIADDLSYGTGVPQKKEIYTTAQVNQFKVDYESFGLNEDKHALFTNKKDFPAVTPTISKQVNNNDTSTNKKKRLSLIIEETSVKKDNTFVKTPSTDAIYKEAAFRAEEATKNQKAIYSRNQIYKVDYGIFDIGGDIEEYHEEYDGIIDLLNGEKRSDSLLFDLFKENAELFFARGELQFNINRMIAKFKSNTGGIYEDPILTKHVLADPSTDTYCMYIENYIAEKIKQETFENILKVEDRSPDFDSNLEDELKRRKKQKIKGNDITNDIDGFTTVLKKPQYSYGNWYNPKHLWKAGKGLTIATNDIWSTEVVLKELKNDGENYTCKYQVTLWDHFGLDIPDMQKPFNIMPGIRETFICWFVLQHLRGYKPFVTKITFNKEFKGVISEGREERRADQKEKKAALKKATQKTRDKRTFDKVTNRWPRGPKL
ncbi:DUF3289 family protein [Tenacibaculum finnmarkense]|uniref:DUF3289 family protein n=1 Tax=Tenacibaculum finnmarkense TaxID=2781243 RepID=UPI00187B4373|nr:DUF3289 family protein [Tenacibaculum finnmarkense]MBE7661014.1 DUF3289 family protein [Tenacibaculum finnmarkense genomovar finnmarkense]MCG8253153.1 DUF3289 family protein [Tenacibaculum finnmarkense genomovar finnmarkense]MCG8821671.1 DUF3289 family protein [Tenacibaculum finnmarkense]